LSKSKMPPQQHDRLLDVTDDGLCFGAHDGSIQWVKIAGDRELLRI
jgi:hypothetical protein